MLGDTIVAVSTPRGKGGVALLRISGEDAVAVAARVFKPKNQKPLDSCEARRAIYGELFAPDGNGAWQAVDDGIATVFRAPSSFTGEDTVELCCHGGILLTETLLTACLTAGARPATAGEFTRRAVLNGKMGLSAAEALGNMLEATTREQVRLAHSGMGGRVEQKTASIYDTLCRILASIYVRIDYPDEDLADMTREEIVSALVTCERELSLLVGTYRTGHAIAEGIATVICGRPNVGKSTLYNRIVGRDAAIVTDLEGTTRDILTETAAMGRVTLRLFDTAGLRKTSDPVEQIGIGRAEQALKEAELILAVFDGSRDADSEDLALIEQVRGHSAVSIAVLNKTEAGKLDHSVYQAAFDHVVEISALEGQGLDRLSDCIEALFLDGKLDVGQDAVLTNARQNAAALSALEAVQAALSALGQGYPIDVCCTDAENAMAALSELDGRSVSEDIVAEIFSHFCVGK